MIQTVIIDDVKDNCMLLKALLDKWGYPSAYYTDAAEAYDSLNTITEPTLIILDWMMPGLSGIDICHMLQECPPPHPIYIILVTAKTNPADLAKGLLAGANDFVTKPFEKEILYARYCAGRRCLTLEEKLLEQKIKAQRTLNIIEKDVHAGKIVQQKMLPENQSIQGTCHFEYFFMPSLYLSGDFLDYFPLKDKGIGFYFADVSGHGASSAFITILLKSYISNMISEYYRGLDDTILHPERVVSIINRKLVNEKLGKHVVLFFAILNQDENKLTYVNAGYFPKPILCTRNEKVILNGKNMATGLYQKAVYKSHSINLATAFSLYLYSDGILEELTDSENLEEQINTLVNFSKYDRKNLDDLKTLFEFDYNKSPADDITILKISRGI